MGLRDAISMATGGSSRASTPDAQTDTDNAEKAEEYLLKVTAGPSYDPTTHSIVAVNSSKATSFESDSMSVNVRVRVRDYHGLPRGSPTTSPYFTDPDRKGSQYSVAFSFVPKRDIPSTDVVWGNDMDHSVKDRLPPGCNTAFKIVKNFIDPGLECDMYAEKPWMYGPALSCWFSLNVGDKGGESKALLNAEEDNIIAEGGQGSGNEVRKSKGLPETSDKRRKYFLDETNRSNFQFEAGRLYEGDFYNGYISFSEYSLKLPGFSLCVLKYIGDKTHTLRYVCRQRNGEVFFVVVFTLLFGDELKKELQQGQTESKTLNGTSATPQHGTAPAPSATPVEAMKPDSAPIPKTAAPITSGMPQGQGGEVVAGKYQG